MSDIADVAKQELVKQTVILLFGLLSICFYMILMKPDFFRTQLMKMSLALRQGASRLALMAGYASMSNELETGTENYGMPYALSQLRDVAARWYEKAREMGR